jgi:hypothetical protein
VSSRLPALLLASSVLGCGGRADLGTGDLSGADESTKHDAGSGVDATATDEADATVNDQAAAVCNALCCPCASDDTAADAAAPGTRACVNIDLSTYDTSCSTDSDCMAVLSGEYCAPTCQNACLNAAINRDGEARYWQTLEQATPQFCECGNYQSHTFCNYGVCTFSRLSPLPWPPQ